MVFTLDGHPLARFDARYLVAKARYEVVQRRRGSAGQEGERHYVCYFSAILQKTSFRPQARAPRATQAGLQLGVVIGSTGDEIFPDEMGRVRVQLHWDRLGKRDHTAGKWMRVAQRGTPGSMLLPRVGWNVATFNEEGAIDAPDVLSRIHDGEHPPSYSLPANKTRVVWKTATSPGGGSHNEIYFEDKRGAEEMFLNASRDMTVYVQNLKTDMVARDQARRVGVNHDLNVTDQYREKVYVNQSVAIGGSESITADDGRSKVVAGNEAQSIGGSRKIDVGEGCSTGVNGSRSLDVGSILVDQTLGIISATSKDSIIDVGGSLLRVAGAGIADEAGKASSQTVSASKIEATPKSRTLRVDMAYAETISGSFVQFSGGTYIDNADTRATWIVGGALSGRAPEIWVEAREEIRVRCGESAVVITPSSIEITSPSLDLSGAHLQAETATISHN
jgi:type VI secretion system secreted protein VgrG